MHILSLVTDNCSSWISGRGRIAVEMFSWPSLHERMCRTYMTCFHIKLKVLSHRERASDVAVRLTEKLGHCIFQWFFHTAALRVQREYIIEIYSVLIFPLVALLHRSLARSLALCLKGPLLWNATTGTLCWILINILPLIICTVLISLYEAYLILCAIV